MICDKCIYNKNCQFLAKHKKLEVVRCTAFTDIDDLTAQVIAERETLEDVQARNEAFEV